MKCPNCKEPNLVMSERKGIEIDYCPECRGVWLDRGELDKIIERSAEPAPAEKTESNSRDQAFPQSPQGHQNYPNPYAHPQHSGPYQKPYKRKKSFLEELFD